MKRFLVMMIAALAVVFGFGFAGEVLAQPQEAAKAAKVRKPHRNRGPRFDSIVVQNGEVGDLDRDVRVVIKPLARSGKPLRSKRSEQVTITIPGGGAFSWERASFGRLYSVEVTELPDGGVLLRELHINVRGFVGRVLKFAGIPKPVDPRIAQVAQLQEELAALKALLAESNGQNDALQQQISLLLLRIADLEEQIAGGTPVTGPVITRNPAFVNPAYVPGASGVKAASFVITASTAQAVQIHSLTLDRDANTGLSIQNLVCKVGATQFGESRPVIQGVETGIGFSSANPISVPAGGSVVVDLYVDVLSNSSAETYASVFDLIGWSAIGSISGSAIAFPGDGVKDEIAGQDIRVVDGPILTVLTSVNTSPARFLVMGSAGNSLATVRFTADGTDDLRITDIPWVDTIGGGSVANIGSFENLTLWDGETQVAGPVSMTVTNSTVGPYTFASKGTISFSLGGAGITVPKYTSKELQLRGDVATYASGGATSSSTHRFSVDANGVIAKSAGSPGETVAVIDTNNRGNLLTISRTILSVGGGTNGDTSGHARTANDEPFLLSFTFDPAADGEVRYVELVFKGGAVPSSISPFTVDLIDYSTNAALSGATQATATYDSTKGGWVAKFTLAYTGSAGSPKWVKLRLNSTGFVASGSLAVLLDDVTWSDGLASFRLTDYYGRSMSIVTSY